MKHIRRSFTVLAAAVLLSLGSLALAAPAHSSSDAESLESNTAIIPALGPGLLL